MKTHLLKAVACLALLAVSCREGAPPPYVRLSGRAPAVADAPPARALLVVFWATWCLPCREETPALRALAADPPQGLAVVVVSQDAEWTKVEELFAGAPDPRLHLRLDPEKRLYDTFGVEALPASFLVVGGELRAGFKGPHRWNDRPMRDLLERLVAEPGRLP